ncbi:Acetolactate synthase, small subunit [Leptospira biflexa serovar Patoc strain 'Patoc 1 (Ames)']|jgi:acetolactate synthase-1/3 small subunit|uniref:Acetolactate synthase small subunit n=1 Tax=Leptospira biflexa serovar Patoc (strain Patoc 1 / ATCC 23582 / Paris) TaxID=456481 RepID=B0SKV9_LEPBP|nr:acetolactate synthase small subunit [Leptospira biflexa]ABZ94784.1 Acetolactate synthase, small subunit [Leptospira biflexa serovar Patoc strain 'Patoc 1 (Ames)']ABZ98452.1 Acetolactate synthase small subunit [Leptospira biflexa serovar Patoc strain 'Patoc 1 (Paris)']
MKHTLSILVNNHPGVMSHVSGLFTRRGYNIDSIAVGVTDNAEVSSMTIVLNGDDFVVGQVKNQLLKLPDVLRVQDMAYASSVQRELVLVSFSITENNRSEALTICNGFDVKILEMTEDSLLIEFSGNSRQVTNIITVLKPFGIREISRTGQIAIAYRNQNTV